MNSAYYTYLSVLGISAFLGLFFSPALFIKIAVVSFGISIAGLLLSALFSAENAVWFFGLASMGIPVFGVIALGGAIIGAVARSVTAKIWTRISSH